jgi:hypothetical protein
MMVLCGGGAENGQFQKKKIVRCDFKQSIRKKYFLVICTCLHIKSSCVLIFCGRRTYLNLIFKKKCIQHNKR